ncbi:MAG: magnesium and cobalt transport protein CorA [Methylococcus sp.]|nr:MAG: magnesium and cobalt transport protein CorA [Methylococcus sp.]
MNKGPQGPQSARQRWFGKLGNVDPRYPVQIPVQQVLRVDARQSPSLSPPKISCIDFSDEQIQQEVVTDFSVFIHSHRPSWSSVRWIHVENTHQPETLETLAEKYHLHPLAIEDIMMGNQRPKVEDYPAIKGAPGRLFIVTRVATIDNGHLETHQISLFLGRNTVISFQDGPAGVFDSLIKRLQHPVSRIRIKDAGFLCHGLMDAIVDSYFPVLEHFSGCIGEIEEDLLEDPKHFMLQRAHVVKRGLLLLKRSIWPMREVISQLQRDRHECLSEETLTYFRDVYDHCVQILDLNETAHEVALSLTETYMSVVSNRMNEIVKVLTIISTIFIPLTFVAGVYGMNMPIPENDWEWTYPVFWIFCIVIASGMLAYFRRLGWI